MPSTPSTPVPKDAAAIDPRDLNTPDAWIPRHPELIRLTGRHPFNCEPPPDKLQTFITPTELHYVRNHGAVPRTTWVSHELRIDGLVTGPRSFTMQELVERFKDRVVTLPVLLVCAGNRRTSSIPGRPSSVTKSQELNKPPSSGTRSNLAAPRVKSDSQAPPLSAERERSASSSYEQRREAAQKLKEDKAQRELQARESARKQREDARRKLEEAQQKEMAAKRERVARMRMQKDQRKGPVKPVSTTR